MLKHFAVLAGLSFVVACDQSGSSLPLEEGSDAQGHSAATAQTAQANADVAKLIADFDDSDIADAKRGLIAQAESLVVTAADGRAVWDQDAYAFLQQDPPQSANPSLWRQAGLNSLHGLFEVVPGIYQLRGFDLANMSLIRGDSGWIVVDPLTVTETAERGMAFVREHLLKEEPVAAIIFTHSHVDHFGGVAALTKDNPNVMVVAPEGFLEESVSENVMAGIAMQRRAGYMYGRDLARSPRGHIGTGLGKEPPLAGTISIARPTHIINKTGQTLTIDGVEFEFQNAPGSEAPAELTFYLPKFKAFCGAEVVSRNIHNVYTLRGAKVRDALLWSKYIQQAIDLFGDRSDVYFGSHQWPIWGQQKMLSFMSKQRDIYQYIHDQTLRMANLGYTPNEIAERMTLPKSLQSDFANRGYYGTIKHNAKAVYQRYFGWYDANPANLDPLPPAEAGQRYVQVMGGAAAVISQAKESFGAGEYRWTAQLLNHLVMAEPDNADAKSLLATTYDQLGYQAESGPWRDVYLSAAYELRHGKTKTGINIADAVGLLRELPMDTFFDSMAARLNGLRADGETFKVNFNFTDLKENHVLHIENAVLHHRLSPLAADADVTLNLTHELFLGLVSQQLGLKDTLMSDELKVEGSRLDLIRFFRLFDQPDGRFAIVTPE
ncbi:MAG: alkyl/aryl-sulfatase [Oceanococcus sp.]